MAIGSIGGGVRALIVAAARGAERRCSSSSVRGYLASIDHHIGLACRTVDVQEPIGAVLQDDAHRVPMCPSPARLHRPPCSLHGRTRPHCPHAGDQRCAHDQEQATAALVPYRGIALRSCSKVMARRLGRCHWPMPGYDGGKIGVCTCARAGAGANYYVQTGILRVPAWDQFVIYFYTPHPASHSLAEPRLPEEARLKRRSHSTPSLAQPCRSA
jgi:hypothetical protein